MKSDPTQFIDLEFVEFDSFVETAQSFDWHPVQLSKGALNLTYRAVDVGDFGAFHLRFDPRVHDKSVTQPETIAFSLVMSPCSFAGVEVTQPTLGIMIDDRVYRSTFEPGFECHEFYCARELVENHPLGELIFDPRKRVSDLVIPLGTVDAYRLKSIFSGLLDATSVFLEPFAREATAISVLNQILRTLAPQHSGASIAGLSAKRNDLVHAALSLIETEEMTLEVAEIAGRLGVTRRALEKSFLNSLGTSPGQFLLARKLTCVRDKLARGVGPVGEVAASEGFEHLSRFASQYRRLFDELPSDTLSRSSLLYQAA